MYASKSLCFTFNPHVRGAHGRPKKLIISPTPPARDWSCPWVHSRVDVPTGRSRSINLLATKEVRPHAGPERMPWLEATPWLEGRAPCWTGRARGLGGFPRTRGPREAGAATSKEPDFCPRAFSHRSKTGARTASWPTTATRTSLFSRLARARPLTARSRLALAPRFARRVENLGGSRRAAAGRVRAAAPPVDRPGLRRGSSADTGATAASRNLRADRPWTPGLRPPPEASARIVRGHRGRDTPLSCAPGQPRDPSPPTGPRPLPRHRRHADADPGQDRDKPRPDRHDQLDRRAQLPDAPERHFQRRQGRERV